jgi:GTP-binding protein LepA
MLHMDVFRQRLKEEHSLEAIITNPSVAYLCKLRGKSSGDIDDDSTLIRVENPIEAPDPEKIVAWKEAICTAIIITPREYYKGIKSLCEDKRGICKSEEFMSNGKTIHLTYEIPLTEMISDFFDTLKSLSQGYASLDYEHARF